MANEGLAKYTKAKLLQKENKPKEAFALLLEAAEEGNLDAYNEVGECYFYGNGTEQNGRKAFEWYKKAAEKGLAAAQTNLGYCYANAVGVETDYVKSCEWLKKATDQGDADAFLNLGNRYKQGMGVKKDPVEAFRLYMEASNRGNQMGAFMAAFMLYEGDAVKQDYKKAYELFTKCANATNNRQARYYAGEMALFGKGTEKNLKIAAANLSLSSLQGYSDAIDLVDKYGSQLFSDQLTDAFYNWIVSQTVQSADPMKSLDAALFGLRFYCQNKGLDNYETIGVVGSKLFDMATSNFRQEDCVQLNFVKLARKWVR